MLFQLKKGQKGRLLARTLPAMVWFVALAAVALLFRHQSERVELKGIAFSYEQTINSVETGYLRSIPVSLYQEVKKGDTLAIIKENTVAREEFIDASLQAQKATAEAELERLKAELEAAEDRLLLDIYGHKSDVAVMERRLAVDLERTRLEILGIKTTLEPDRLTLKDREVEIEIVKNLLAQNAAENYELQKAQVQYDVLKQKVTQTELLLDEAEKNYDLAHRRKDEFEQSIPVSPQLSSRVLNPIRKAILVQERRLVELIKQRDIIVLTAPFDGIINTLNYKQGQTVVRGDAIMTIVKPTPETIITWVSQRDMNRFGLNMKVKVVSLNSPYQTFESQISHISPFVELLPERLWRNPTFPEWGRSVQIPIQPSFVCIHNEVVGVKTIVQ